MKWSKDQVELSSHALEQMGARGIGQEQVEAVLAAPEAVLDVREGRVVAQAVLEVATEQRRYLYRVFVDIDREPAVVVTAYRTSQIEKYRNRP